MARFHVTITSRDAEAVGDLVRKHELTVARHSIEKLAKGYRVDAHATSAQIRVLETAGYKVKRREDVEREGRKRQAEHGRARALRAKLARARSREGGAKGDAAATPKGAGGYLGVDEVEAALAAAAGPQNAGFTELMQLPEKTWEGRSSSLLRIGKGNSADRPGIYLLGGVHAREWGSPDILVNFVEQLTSAYRNGASVKIGKKTFAAARLKRLVEGKDVYVFPQVNPDGRLYSMTKDSMWRKNRRPSPDRPSCIGVDINRNYDFLWNFPKFFSPSAPIANSVDCSNDTYIGPSPFSEPETRNAAWAFGQFPKVRYFIDVHSYSEDILYSWGDDDLQTSDPSMSFGNPAFDGKRGIPNDAAYREFMPALDRKAMVKLAAGMRGAIQAVRGRVYKVEPAVGLYPTAGTSDDYAFSRHLVDGAKPKVYSFTIEWGSPKNSTPFHPPYAEMQKIIQEITAALLDFCLRAT
jgi:murein tripeptide amidase MpaA